MSSDNKTNCCEEDYDCCCCEEDYYSDYEEVSEVLDLADYYIRERDLIEEAEEYNDAIINTCVVCGIDLGDCNPRQLCMKTYCPEE